MKLLPSPHRTVIVLVEIWNEISGALYVKDLQATFYHTQVGWWWWCGWWGWDLDPVELAAIGALVVDSHVQIGGVVQLLWDGWYQWWWRWWWPDWGCSCRKSRVLCQWSRQAGLAAMAFDDYDELDGHDGGGGGALLLSLLNIRSNRWHLNRT